MGKSPPDTTPALPENDTPPRRQELEQALRAIYRQVGEGQKGQVELSAALLALVETLAEAGALSRERYEERRAQAQNEAHKDEVPPVRLGKPINKYGVATAKVNCQELLPICKGRCCTLAVYLSEQDLDERILVWDYGKPYRLRQARDGYCNHSDPETRACGVYNHRPSICRSYDCRDDERIWADFDRRIPRRE